MVLRVMCAIGLFCVIAGCAAAAHPSPTPSAFIAVDQATETPSTALPLPTGTPYTYRAHYQAFERGFMVHAEGANCAYIFSTDNGGRILIPAAEREQPFGEYHYCSGFADLPASISDEGAPAAPFDRLWAAYPEFRAALGEAAGAEQWYTVTVYPAPAPVGFGGAPWDEPVIGLPDGGALRCGFRAATAGWCGR